MNRQLLPSTKVTVATLTTGGMAAWLAGVDWESLIIAVVTLVLSYLVPEANPAPSSAARQA